MAFAGGALGQQPSPEATSLLGKPLYAPPLTPENKAKLEANLAAAKADYDKAPADEEKIIWLGRRTAYLGRFRESIRIYSEGLARHPNSYKLLRHRGHRYITVRELDRAAADLEKASRLIRNVPIEVEPDGVPNAKNTPHGTSHTSIWYHLGLAYYLKGDFAKALGAYRECLKLADNDDMKVATADWMYMTLRRLGRRDEAAKVLVPIGAEMSVLDNVSYHSRLLMYKGLKSPESLLDTATADPTQIATQGYGVANWYFYNGDREKARALFEKIIAGAGWPAFGYIAAEADLRGRR